jgi:hypothetical protein
MSTYSQPSKAVLRRSVELGQFTSWVFTRRAQESGLFASMGSIGDCYDCEDPWAVVEPSLAGSPTSLLRVA